MKRKAKIFLPLAVLASAALLTAVIVKARPKVERQEISVPPPLVRVIEAERRDLDLIVRSQGTVQPRVESTLVAQVPGRILGVASEFAVGGFFQRGQVLVRIEADDYRLGVAQAEARVAQAKVRLDLERAEAELARQDWEELGEGEPPSLVLREPQLAEARAGLRSAEAALEQERLNLSRTTIRAPFAGRIRDKRVDIGQYVSPGTPLAAVYSIDSAEIRLPVAQDQLAYLEIDLGPGVDDGSGLPVRLFGELGGQVRSWPARVVRSGGEFDPRSRMLPLFARIDDPFALRSDRSPLPMGLFVRAEIAGRTVRGVVVVPRQALRSQDRILVVDSDSRLRFRSVDVLRIERDSVILSGGIDNGEQICISSLETFVDGMRVRTLLEPETPTTDEQRERAL